MQTPRPEKRCATCRELKPVSEFHRNSSRPDGLYHACKRCWLKVCEDRRRALGMKPWAGPPRSGRFYDLPLGQKYCARCQAIKPQEQFYRVRSDNERRFAWCIPCAKADQERRRRAKGIKPRLDTSDTKRCPRCGETKPLSAFSKNPRSARGVQSYCMPCYRAYARELAKKNRATALRRQRRKRALGPSKHELAARMVFLAVKLGVLTKGPCAICGSTDHVQGHHTDYTKPLDVTWLCRLHHFHAHGQLLDQTQ